MEVNNVKPMDRVLSTGVTGASQSIPQQAMENKAAEKKNDILYEQQKQPTSEELLPITKELNKFMSYLNADIQFALHDKTQQLMVKVVDVKEQKVLREFPPKEFLDMVANIREYIGIILDKKA